jgi:hypothetical protein
MNRNILLSMLFMLGGYALRAQNMTTENLVWHVSYVDDVNIGEREFLENEKLVTYGSGRIEWHNADGSIKHTYAINNIGGTWSNVGNNGSVVYQFKNGDQLGTVTFERANDEIMVRVLLGKDDELPVIYEIKIVKITTL